MLEFRRYTIVAKPDIINCHGVRAGLIGRLACIGLKNSTKIIYTEHLWTFQYHLANPVSHWFQILMLKILDRFTFRTIAVSKAVADFLVKSGISSRKKVAVLYSGIQLPREGDIVQKEDHPIKIIGFVGSLAKRKGLEYLIRAIPLLTEKMPDKFKVVVIGKGENRKELIGLAKEVGVGNYIKFVGSVENVADYYQSFDIYVQPSLDEAFGMATLEAMSYGLPVVVSDVGGLPEVINYNGDPPRSGSFSHCSQGAIIAPRDHIGLAKALAELLVNEDNLKKCSVASFERAKRFSIDKTTKQREAFYKMISE
jgi:glycosyltransferase involved in cell wall biosynthesis